MGTEHNPNELSHRLDDPANPPESLLKPEVRRAALMSYLGSVIVLFAVVGVALLYWANRGPVRDAPTDRDAVGTVGLQLPGGGNPERPATSSEDEIKYRGIDPSSQPVTTIANALSISPASPQRVELSNVIVDRLDGQTVWVRDADARIAVVAPRDAAPREGGHVNVSGTTEPDGQGAIRVRATAMTPVRK